MLKTSKESGLQWFWHEVCSHVNITFLLDILKISQHNASYVYYHCFVSNKNSCHYKYTFISISLL
ncbi:hypothetical protein [Candidatus Tisiphia endosymbiont of Myopa tessellatipennis]|uniref:hypothetical protein n=2 Tax=Candidatus Tisiphia TaxID=2996317 RepID=UPI00313C75A4